MPADPPAPALPDGFALEALLAPIPGDTPQGTDLREDTSAQSPWFRLRDARAEARELERRAETEGGDDGGIAPPWKMIHTLARTALLERSKDLDVAAMLTEALLRMHGLPGLTAGALLIKGLAERYWDGVFPLPDEYEGVAARVAGITGLSGSEKEGLLLPPLRRLVVFTRPDGNPFAWWQYERSRELATIVDAARKEQRIKAGAIPLDQVEKDAKAVSPKHFAALRRQLKDAAAAWAGMAATLDGLAGQDGPSTGRVRDLLDEMLAMVGQYAPPEEVEAPIEEGAMDATEEEAEGSPAAGAPRGGQPARTREDVLRQLVEIADYFKRTEPNSPLAYTLQDAVRRARLSWPELLTELVPDGKAREAILVSLGIKPEGG
ncbi:type VI secretion system protein TssA [Falsiroseomonas oryzae]|uniref:type VI secretion system protein TssA n=1 Tax=Falsiroseomonas oryzae TaxID=2766473 RepID=UPI0022EAE3D0|nr:type VI secretion system protein TssA [Roseomonas sp. MO-31]